MTHRRQSPILKALSLVSAGAPTVDDYEWYAPVMFAVEVLDDLDRLEVVGRN
jgi:hypothetical protein